MATKTDINFTELIDLSLGTPEVVNYKGLRVLLAAIVSQLGVGNVKLELSEGDKKELNDVKESYSNAKEVIHPRSARGRQETTNINNNDIVNVLAGDVDKSKSIADAGPLSGPSGSTSFPKVLQDMEEKMSRLEGQLSVLNALPSNESLRARSQGSDEGNKGKTTPVSDMWQLMQCQRKATANEEGVSKLMSMVEDLMRELQGISHKLEDQSSNISDINNKHGDMQKEIDKINEFIKSVEHRISSLEASSGQQDKIDELNRLMDDLRRQLAGLPHVDAIVTWPAFEAALKGAYKEPIDHSDSSMQTAPITDHSRIQTMPLNDASAQTSTPIPPTPSPPPSRPVSSRSVRSAMSSASYHPTQEIQRVLRELGELTGKHNLLDDRVSGLEELLGKKADKSWVEDMFAQWDIPGDLVKKLAELEDGLNHLRDSRAKDDRSMADMLSSLAQLQDELEKLNKSYVHLVDEHNVKQKHIDALYTFVDRLQENKADKEHVIMEIDVKADKRALDNKVSRSQFDGTVDELSKNLHEVMDKMAGHRVAWDSAVSSMKLDIDNKLDRMELDPLKSYLDNRIKSVSSKYVKKEVETGEDAAGFRKPLQKFHCISCDRPLDMASQPPIASLPESKGLAPNRSGRPYTTYELEQIRAAQKNGNYQDVPDYFVASRACGGSHTMTFPHRRITRVSQTTNMVTTTEDTCITPVVNGRVEADIQGQDGHIYKGRLDSGHMTERLPTLTQPKMSRAKSPRVSSARGRRSLPPTRQSAEPLDNTPLAPMGTALSRPASARNSPRPTSARPPPSGSPGGRGSPVASPDNNVDDSGVPLVATPPPPRDTPTETITVPQPPPPDQDQS